jgi:hypothetical protein
MSPLTVEASLRAPHASGLRGQMQTLMALGVAGLKLRKESVIHVMTAR